MLSDPVAEAFGLIHRHPSGENFFRAVGVITVNRKESGTATLTQTKDNFLSSFSVLRGGGRGRGRGRGASGAHLSQTEQKTTLFH